MIHRRAILMGLGSAALGWPLRVAGQQRLPVIGILGSASPDNPEVAANLAAFREGLSEAGFVEGQNIAIEYRWAHNEGRLLPALAAELVARHVDVIVIEGGTPSALAAKKATSTIPIVFHAADAVADELVSNLARPDGNLTGVSLFGPEGLAKQYQLCVELLPEAKTIALVIYPKALIGDYATRALGEATRSSGAQFPGCERSDGQRDR
jgi:putative ABC transport system substrate-binding protein